MAITQNGHLADDLREAYADHERRQTSRIDDLVAELELDIMAEEHGRAELERLIADSRTREHRMRKALGALKGRPLSHAARVERPTEPKRGWQPSDERVEFVLGRFRDYLATDPPAEQRTKTALRKWMNAQGDRIAGETINRAMTALRERELVRVTGKARGGGDFIDLMPAGDDAG
jgi:hypothetical protein